MTSYGRSCGAPQTPALYATIPRVFVAAQVFGKHRITNNPKRQNENVQLNNGYGSQQYQSASLQQNNNRFESQQQNNNRFENQQQNNNRFDSQQQNVNKYSNQQLNSDYRRPQSSDNSYTSSLYTSDLYDNQKLTVNKFGNLPQTTNRYNNQQQNVNKYVNQQNSNIYELSPNTYQQLSHTGRQHQIGQWNKQNGNIGDDIPAGGWVATNERVEGDFVADSWNFPRQSNQDGNYFATTARPWWNR